MTTPLDESAEPARAPVPAKTEEAAPSPAIDTICPYLVASHGGWRSAAPDREHRCTAVDPPAPLPLDKQRSLCLVPEHTACPAFREARASRASMLAPGLDPAIVASTDAARRPIARSTAVVLERPRFAITGIGGNNVAVYQAILVALMVLAFAIVAVTQLTAGNAGSSGPPPSPGPSATPTPTATPRPTPTRSPSPAASGVTPSSSGTLPSAAPSEAAFRTTYRVQAGDTLVGIAAEFGTTVAAVQQLNGLTGSDLNVGLLLKIP
jgi:LysM repeat protein